jgi:hypothetical protein
MIYILKMGMFLNQNTLKHKDAVLPLLLNLGLKYPIEKLKGRRGWHLMV